MEKEKKTLINFSCTQDIKKWYEAKRVAGYNLSAIFCMIMEEVMLRERKTGDMLAHDIIKVEGEDC